MLDQVGEQVEVGEVAGVRAVALEVLEVEDHVGRLHVLEPDRDETERALGAVDRRRRLGREAAIGRERYAAHGGRRHDPVVGIEEPALNGEGRELLPRRRIPGVERLGRRRRPLDRELEAAGREVRLRLRDAHDPSLGALHLAQLERGRFQQACELVGRQRHFRWSRRAWRRQRPHLGDDALTGRRIRPMDARRGKDCHEREQAASRARGDEVAHWAVA
jgi:hypothetical protein